MIYTPTGNAARTISPHPYKHMYSNVSFGFNKADSIVTFVLNRT